MKNQKANILFIIIGINVIFALLYPWLGQSRAGISILSNIMIIAASIACYFFIRHDDYLKQRVGISKKDVKILVAGLIIVSFFTLVVIHLLNNDLKGYLENTSWANQVRELSFTLIILFYIIISIPLQEFIFRGYIMGALRSWKSNNWAVVVVSSILYSVSHLHYGWEFIVITFLFGLFMGWLMLKYKRLLYPIIVHLVGGGGLFIFYFLWSLM
ncbi:CPBP family intramembrane metalloprotease [Patescibacteria group bacterium]|nr:CPBP family intramembrane metalloprotease [Patescibacteria group bacterium]MBU0964316.1 CPBP family intramembrane metalloprotease [Patescibacteria group bacterium]